MRPGLAVLLALVAACASSAPPGSPPPPDREACVALAASELSRDGSPRAEEVLFAAGPDAVPWLVALSRHESERVSRRAQSLLLSLGHADGITVDEQVRVLLFDIERSREAPAAALLALARVRALGASAIPTLREASDEGGARSGTARTLLALLGEDPR